MNDLSLLACFSSPFDGLLVYILHLNFGDLKGSYYIMFGTAKHRHRKHLFAVIFVLPAACRARWISYLSWLQNLFPQISQRLACDFHLFLQTVFLLEIKNCNCCCTWVKFAEFEICLSTPKLNRALP